MIKYLVGYEETPDLVVGTRADAEEYILSLVEEAAYEDYVADVLYYDMTTAEHIEDKTRWMDRANGFRSRPWQTLYGFLLNYHGDDYWISEVGVLE